MRFTFHLENASAIETAELVMVTGRAGFVGRKVRTASNRWVSSDPSSEQSTSPSHTHKDGMHRPVALHRNSVSPQTLVWHSPDSSKHKQKCHVIQNRKNF